MQMNIVKIQPSILHTHKSNDITKNNDVTNTTHGLTRLSKKKKKKKKKKKTLQYTTNQINIKNIINNNNVIM